MAVCEAYGYKVDRLLGRGAFGSVCRATKDNKTVAIKHIAKRFRSWTECLQQREIASLKKCQDRGGHANLIRVMEVIHAKADGSVFIVMEFVDGGNLYDAMKKNADYFSTTKAAGVARDVLRGLAHMHRRGFFHRDIKPENILVCQSTKRCKIADLGCAREVRSAPPYTDYVSTRWYRAPENALRSKVYSSPVDVWACGCVLGELLMKGRPLFPATSEADLAHKIFQMRGNPWQAGWQDGIRLATGLRLEPPADKRRRRAFPLELRGADVSGADLCDALLRLDPAARPSAQAALDHAFLRNAPRDEPPVAVAAAPPATTTTTTTTATAAPPARAKALPDPSARFSYGGLFDDAAPPAAAAPEADKPRRFEPSAAFSYDFGRVGDGAPLDLAAADAAVAASPVAGAFAAFGLPPPRADASDGDDVAPVCQLPSPPPALPSPVAFASPRAGPSFLASTASTTASTSPEVLAATTSSSPEVLAPPREDSPSALASTAASDSPEVLAAVPTPVSVPAFAASPSDASSDAAPPSDSEASSSPEASPRGPMPSPDDTAARAARVLGSSIDDSSSSDGDEAPRAADAADATPSTRASPSTCDASPATPIFSPPAIPAIGDATPARASPPPSLLARAHATASPAAWQTNDPGGRDENDDPTPWTDAEVRRLKIVVADAYKRARAGGATERADWYAAVWRDVRRALGHARPIREYQAKYKLLIAEKKRLRALRPAFVDPAVETRAPAFAPDDGTWVEEF